jgi:hypothetical protein
VKTSLSHTFLETMSLVVFLANHSTPLLYGGSMILMHLIRHGRVAHSSKPRDTLSTLTCFMIWAIDVCEASRTSIVRVSTTSCSIQ